MSSDYTWRDDELNRLMSRRRADRTKPTNLELATFVGVTERTIHNWRNGRPPGKYEHVMRVAEFFGVDDRAIYRRKAGKR